MRCADPRGERRRLCRPRRRPRPVSRCAQRGRDACALVASTAVRVSRCRSRRTGWASCSRHRSRAAGSAPTGAALVLAEWRDPGGGGDPPLYIAPLHVHHEDDEAWYVLEGALDGPGRRRTTSTRPGRRRRPRPARAPRTPTGTRSPTPTRYLLVMTPRIAALIEALHALETRNADQPSSATFARARERVSRLAVGGRRSARGCAAARPSATAASTAR